MVQGLKFKPNFNSNVDDDVNKKCTKKGMVQGLRFELNNGDNLRFRNSRGDNSIKKDFNNINEQNDVHYKFSTCFEKCVFVLGLFTAVICGFVQPIMNQLYGEFMTLLVGRFTKDSIMSEPLILSYFGGGKTKPNATTEDQMAFLIADGKAYFLSSLILGIIQLIVSFLMITCLGYYALKKVGKMRRFFLEALFQQDIAWHDKENTGAGLASTMAQLDTLRDGLNENLGMVVYLITSFVVNVTVAFLVAWKLTLILVIVSPIFLGASGLLNKKKNTMYLKESDSCKSASAVAQEVLSSIRTVVAFNGEEKEVKRYEEHLNVAKKLSILSNVYSGLGNGVTWMLMFMTYAICFWFGTPLILADRLNEVKSYTPGAVATVLFCMSVATLNIGLLAPYLESLIKARTASHGVLRVLGRKSQINPFSTSGKEIGDKIGTIEFRNVHFSYPTRPNVKVLQGLDLKINQGESVALVGASGSGKSTTIQLLERFYNPDSGSILLNDVDISELRLSWLRRQIGLVGQEPVLFNTTISKNICGDLDVSYEEMVRAAQDANVHDFISSLPEGYETIVGEHGSRFSGGQKQRIAIARALVRKPSILLLDEATSALDVASEGIVQNALDRASQGRTTITIAHRLSSIQNVDRIVVIEEGKAVEQGTHQELMEKQGKYYSLVSADATLQHNIKNKEIDTKGENEKDTEDILLEPHLNPNPDEETVVQTKEPGVSWTRLWQLNKPDVGYLIAGSLGSLVVGIASPLSALLYGNYNFALSGEDENYVIRMANMYALCFVAVAVIVFFSIFLQFSLLGLAGARLTNRLRVSVFGVILKQDMSWFDEDRNCVSTLTTRLSSDANTIQDASGCKLGALMQAVGTIIIGIIMSLFYSWKMTLMCSMGVPIICASLVIEAVITKKTNNELRVCIEQASKVAIEGMSNIRTVASLGLEPMITEHYNMKLKTAEKSQIVMTRYRGVVFALGYSSINIAYSFAIYYSVYLIVHESLPFINTIIVSETILFGTWLVVQLLTLAPNISAGRNAAGRLFNILDRKPQIYNPPYDTGKMPSGDVLYSQVRFSYPKRSDTVILKGLDLNIIRGQTVALVGLSGSGKSTCIQLLQRFYDPVSGTVSIGDKDITAASIHRVRAEIGIVSQEPVLFDRTIAENIAYGDNTRVIEINEIIDAAKKANVHDFINSLPAGYETRLGTRGMQLSGGQKQRIAIARALIRNPPILILDEATSALDTQNEKIVQEALEGATDGRTCIMIAHRLSTVARCDVIYVLSNGEVVESGTHSELLALNKHYAQLLRQQQS